eukprot:Pgem_evm1s2372
MIFSTKNSLLLGILVILTVQNTYAWKEIDYCKNNKQVQIKNSEGIWKDIEENRVYSFTTITKPKDRFFQIQRHSKLEWKCGNSERSRGTYLGENVTADVYISYDGYMVKWIVTNHENVNTKKDIDDLKKGIIPVECCANRNFTGADLSGLDLQGLDFEGADFSGADLRNSNFTNANLRNAKLDTAIFSDETALSMQKLISKLISGNYTQQEYKQVIDICEKNAINTSMLEKMVMFGDQMRNNKTYANFIKQKIIENKDNKELGSKGKAILAGIGGGIIGGLVSGIFASSIILTGIAISGILTAATLASTVVVPAVIALAIFAPHILARSLAQITIQTVLGVLGIAAVTICKFLLVGGLVGTIFGGLVVPFIGSLFRGNNNIDKCRWNRKFEVQTHNEWKEIKNRSNVYSYITDTDEKGLIKWKCGGWQRTTFTKFPQQTVKVSVMYDGNTVHWLFGQ